MPDDKASSIRDSKARYDYATKQATGSLFRAVTLSTDPGQKLMFSNSLISITRAALIQKMEDKIPDAAAIEQILNSLLLSIARDWTANGMIDEPAMGELSKRCDLLFKSESMMRYDLELFRDIRYCDESLQHWRKANQIYISNNNAWAIANDILSEVHKVILEIIVRHNLMQFPKGEIFNIDNQGATMSRLAKIMQDSGGDE